MTAPVPLGAPARPRTLQAGVFMGGWLALLWALEVADQLAFNALDAFGISPRDPGELPQVFTAPFLHFGFGHLASNSLPFFVLGLLVLLTGVRAFAVSTLAAVLGSGLFAWALSAPATVTAGASGLVFGWLAYLLARGLFSRSWRAVLLALVVFAVYGGVLWGVLPGQPGISWQGHLGGLAGGLVVAALLVRRTPAGRDRPWAPLAAVAVVLVALGVARAWLLQ